MTPVDLTAKGWEYAIANGPFAVMCFVLICAFIAYYWHSERVKTRQSLSKEKLWAATEVLQEKRVLERDEIMRALVTTGIALKEVATSTEANNRAIEAHTRAVDGTRDSNLALLSEIRALKEVVSTLGNKIDRLLEPRRR